MTRSLAAMAMSLVLFSLTVVGVRADDRKDYRFRAFAGDVSSLTPLDLQATKSTHPSWIRQVHSWGDYKWSGEWDRFRLVNDWEGEGGIDWNLRSTGGPDLLADLLEEDLAGEPLYSYEEPFVKDCLSRINGNGVDRAKADLQDFLWRGARMNVRASLVVKHSQMIPDEPTRRWVIARAQDAERFGVSEYTLPWEAAWDSMRYVFLCETAGTLDRRMVPVVMLYLTHRYPTIREAAAKTISSLTHQVWLGDHSTPFEGRRVQFVQWWKEHRKDPLWKWYATGMPAHPFSELVARSRYGDMEAVRALATRLSKMTVEEYIMVTSQLSHFSYLNVELGLDQSDLERLGVEHAGNPPASNAPEEKILAHLTPLRRAMEKLLKSLDPNLSWLEWKIRQAEAFDDTFDLPYWQIKAWTNRSFGMEKLMTRGGDWDGWETRLDEVPRLDPEDPDFQAKREAKWKAIRETQRAGAKEIRRWLQGEGKDWSFKRQDAAKIEDQVAYEEFLRRKFPDLLTRLESPARLAPPKLCSTSAYPLFDVVATREHVARYRARVDKDGDGLGEFFRLWGGPDGYWNAKSLEPYPLNRLSDHSDLAECDRVLLRVFVPESTDEAERHFACIAWPADDKDPAPRLAGLLLDDSRLFASRRDTFVGLDRIPEMGDLFSAGEEWKTPRADLWEETEWPIDYWR